MSRFEKVKYSHSIGHHGAAPDAGRELCPGGPPGGLVLAAVHRDAQEEYPPQKADDEAHVDGKH